jgi:poly(3-hydroxybutyrate) depolymerase
MVANDAKMESPATTTGADANRVDWSGDGHPLADKQPLNAQQAADLPKSALEVITDKSGHTTDQAISKLSSGDHTIQLPGGRQFMVHVPENDGKTPLPVMMVFSGSAHIKYDPKDFAAETGMSKAADDPQHKFIAVYALPKEHLLGTDSTTPAYAWVQNDWQHQNPELLESFYAEQLGKPGQYTVHTSKAGSKNEDSEKLYTPTNADNPSRLAVFDVTGSDHNWPGPDPTHAATNGNPKDTEFDTTLEIVNLWDQYNHRVII